MESAAQVTQDHDPVASPPPSPSATNQPTTLTDITPGLGSLAALCAMARFQQVAANPATLAHQLGLPEHYCIDTNDLLRAAQHVGLKARLVRAKPERLALMRSEGASKSPQKTPAT